MGYFEHLHLNAQVAFRCFVLMGLHLLHGIIPCKYTSHEYWGYGMNKTVTDKGVEAVKGGEENDEKKEVK